MRIPLLFATILLAVCLFLRFGYHPASNHLHAPTTPAPAAVPIESATNFAADLDRQVATITDHQERAQEVEYVNGFADGRLTSRSFILGVNRIRKRYGLVPLTRHTMDWDRLEGKNH